MAFVTVITPVKMFDDNPLGGHKRIWYVSEQKG